MDLIVCRNVLMYFTPERAAQVLGRLERSLGDGGWLALAPAEFGMSGRPVQLSSVRLADVGFLRKAAPDPSASRAAPPEAARCCPGAGGSRRRAPRCRSQTPTLRQRKRTLPSTTHLLSIAEHATSRRRTWQGGCSLGTPAMRWRWLFLRAFTPIWVGWIAALEWSRDALDAEKLDPVAHYVIAGILRDLGRPSEAVVSLERALFLDQDFSLAPLRTWHV